MGVQWWASPLTGRPVKWPTDMLTRGSSMSACRDILLGRFSFSRFLWSLQETWGWGFIKVPAFRSRVGLEISLFSPMPRPARLYAACAPGQSLISVLQTVHFPLPSSPSLPVSFLPLDGGKSNRLCTISAEGHLGVPSLSRLFKQSPHSVPCLPSLSRDLVLAMRTFLGWIGLLVLCISLCRHTALKSLSA